MIKNIDDEGAKIATRINDAIYYLASKRNGRYPKMLRLNDDKYRAFLQYLCFASIVEFPINTIDCFLFHGVKIYLKRNWIERSQYNNFSPVKL